MEKDESAAENDEELRDVTDRATLAEEEKRQLQAQVAALPEPGPRYRPALTVGMRQDRVSDCVLRLPAHHDVYATEYDW